jgi:hypothetical protein
VAQTEDVMLAPVPSSNFKLFSSFLKSYVLVNPGSDCSAREIIRYVLLSLVEQNPKKPCILHSLCLISAEADEFNKLEILPDPPIKSRVSVSTTPIIQKRIGDTLNLTCRICNEPEIKYDFLWHVPTMFQNRLVSCLHF